MGQTWSTSSADTSSMSSRSPQDHCVEQSYMAINPDRIGDVDTSVGQPAVEEGNGLMFQGNLVPPEIVVLVLSFLDCKTLLQCRRVCRVWKSLIETEVWRIILDKETYKHLRASKKNIPWHSYYMLSEKNNPFRRNLLKNHCGQDGLDHWTIMSNGGDGWRVECPPAGADMLPTADEFDSKTSCFATSYHSCSKHQIINLSAEGFSSDIMDNLVPPIQVSEWFAGRFDCGCVYDLQVELLDQHEKVIVNFNIRESIVQWNGKEWHKVCHEFNDYGAGVRFIKFYHGGTDTQFWAGHYGSKMSGACVKVLLPSFPATEEREQQV